MSHADWLDGAVKDGRVSLAVLASHLDVPVSTTHQWRVAGSLTGCFAVNGVWHVGQAALERFLGVN